ncbi:hypothetical protein ABTZ59_04765 [Streptomyces sp. NPDC094034]|uniref:hypothetical protein n=1 Tax=Streptomyces sp. NPDC094034 TaxID=3155309 RepID=UPI003327B82A
MSLLAHQVNESSALATVPLHTTEVQRVDVPDSVICCPAVGVQVGAALVAAFVAGYNL